MSRRWIGCILLAALVSLPNLRLAAEDEKQPAREESKRPADLQFVFESGGTFVTVRPNELLAATPLKQLPERLKRQLTGELEQAERVLGIAVADIERLTVLLPVIPEDRPVLVVRTRKAYDENALLQATIGAGFRREKYKGFTLCTTRGGGKGTCLIDGQTFAWGEGRGLKETITRIDGRSTPRPHGLAVEWAAAKHQVVLGATAEPFLGSLFWRGRWQAPGRSTGSARPGPDFPDKGFEKKQIESKPPPPEIKEKQSRRSERRQEVFVSFSPERFQEQPEEPDFSDMLANLPVAALPYKPLLQAKSLAAILDLGEEARVQWRFTFENDEAAQDGEVSVRVALYVLRQALGRLPDEIRVPAAMAAKVTALVREVQSALHRPQCSARA